MQNRETPIPGINLTREELEEKLRAGIEALEAASLQKLDDAKLKKFKELKRSFDTENTEAKEKLEKDLKDAAKEPDFLRDHYINSLNSTYKIFLEARIWNLENFKNQLGISEDDLEDSTK